MLLQISDFWIQHGDFWINAGIGVLSIGAGLWAVRMATGAKTAAKLASEKIHKDEILIMLTEVLAECKVNMAIQYSEASSKYTFINNKICNISCFRKNDTKQIQYLTAIADALVNICTVIDSNGNQNAPNTSLYFELNPLFSILQSKIENLRSFLQYE